MGDFLAFRRMLAPVLIHILFWVATIGCLALGGAILGGQIDPAKWPEAAKLPPGLAQDARNAGEKLRLIVGLGTLILGPLLVRLWCEMLMLPFRINGTLTDIRNTLRDQPVARPAGLR
jgi:hypothetical protein